MQKHLVNLSYCALAIFFIVAFSGCDYLSEDEYRSDPYEAGTANDYKTDSQKSSPPFHGYACTEDCSGHEAGYDWAEENEISDPSDCGGNSNSFIEGCESYAQGQDDSLSYEDDEDYDY